MDRIAELREPGPPAEVRKVDDERAADNPAAGHVDQLQRGLGRAAGGDQVVDQKHAFAAQNAVAVDLQTVGAVLELVVLPEVLRRQLAAFANGDEASPQRESERCADDE